MFEQFNIVKGNITADAELRFTQAGKAVSSFTVVQSEKFKKNDGSEGEMQTYWNCTAWGDVAERVSRWIKKGQHVMVMGRAGSDFYKAKDGSTKSKLVLTVEDVFPSLWSLDKTFGASETAADSNYRHPFGDEEEVPPPFDMQNIEAL